MRKTVLNYFGFFIILFCLSGSPAVSGQNARIKFDTDRIVGEVDKNIYGNFVSNYHWIDGVGSEKRKSSKNGTCMGQT